MRSGPAKPHRHSIRLRHYDYARAGAYFVTLVAHHRALLFGEIAGGTNHLTDAGRIVQCTWDDLPKHYSGVECDAFVVMPNHVHGIIQLNDPSGRRIPTGASPRRCFLSEIVRALKTFSARRINEQRPANAGPVWQRNYYDHVIRDDRELLRIREYIVNNPLQWATDRENPMQPPDFKPPMASMHGRYRALKSPTCVVEAGRV